MSSDYENNQSRSDNHNGNYNKSHDHGMSDNRSNSNHGGNDTNKSVRQSQPQQYENLQTSGDHKKSENMSKTITKEDNWRSSNI